MAFKSDWTPGILPYIAPVVVILIIALGLSTLFEEYHSWVSIFVFIAVVALGVSGMIIYYKKHKNK